MNVCATKRALALLKWGALCPQKKASYLKPQQTYVFWWQSGVSASLISPKSSFLQCAHELICDNLL